MMTEQLDEITKTIIERFKPKRIILFGSYARGDQGAESDLDLLVIEESPVRRREETVRIKRALRNFRVPIDVIVCSEATYLEFQEVPGHLFYRIQGEGRVLYAS